MDSFSARLNAAEGAFFASEQRQATLRHAARLVEQGVLPEGSVSGLGEAASFARAGFADVPVTVINARPASEVVFRYNGQAVPKMSATESWARLGTAKVSLGRARWNTDGASIFSVQDGKRLAQTPVKQPSAWELSRMRKISQAAVDTRVVQGIRLMPEYTPARALLWGSILALWGTGAIVATVARGLGIQDSTEASDKLRAAVEPYVGFSRSAFEPLRAWFRGQETGGSLQDNLAPVTELARRMRGKLGHEQAT